jgi:hypothetical protein
MVPSGIPGGIVATGREAEIFGRNEERTADRRGIAGKTARAGSKGRRTADQRKQTAENGGENHQNEAWHL